jgi:hypothetical protein
MYFFSSKPRETPSALSVSQRCLVYLASARFAFLPNPEHLLLLKVTTSSYRDDMLTLHQPLNTALFSHTLRFFGFLIRLARAEARHSKHRI